MPWNKAAAEPRCGPPRDFPDTWSVISNGVIISGRPVRNSLLSPGTRVDSWARVDRSVIMHNTRVGTWSRIARMAASCSPWGRTHMCHGDHRTPTALFGTPQA
jgi:NDP-sugar pyrophosphorylase family protein